MDPTVKSSEKMNWYKISVTLCDRVLQNKFLYLFDDRPTYMVNKKKQKQKTK
jgi:hypothetical protein